MDEQSKNRIRAAMVVYEFEKSLGRYIRERSLDLANTPAGKDILKRAGVTVDIFDSGDQARVIVEHSYLGEVINIACAISSGSSDEVPFEQIKKLSTSLDLYAIRNAVSHPNRAFPDCYWYRCAAIASDPAMVSINLHEVISSFQAALSGSINEPPEDWMFHKEWMVPTTLPEETEHSLTGLLGRVKDSAKLLRELKNPRVSLISVVARGGVGKTSLALQVLSDFIISVDCTEFCDALFFISLKQEKLTTKGVEVLTAPDSIERIKSELLIQFVDEYGIDAPTFEIGCSLIKDKRVWLFVDNLETILRDSPDDFIAFNDLLPEKWRVIVTSRIPVDGAKNIPLDVLDEQSAFSLAKQYFYAKGYEIKDANLLERIANGCRSNPLAIRLTVDLYLAGKDISEALHQTTREVSAFSFTNLLEALSDDANQILEALFVVENPSKNILCDALGFDMDHISAAITELNKTSLIKRVEIAGVETYQLGTSIHELLRSNPRNVGVRSKLIEWAAKSRTGASETYKAQQDNNVPMIDLFYIPEGVPPSLMAIAKKVKKKISNKRDSTRVGDLEMLIRPQLDIHGNVSFLNRIYARVLHELEDLKSAEVFYNKAIALDDKDPAPRYGLVYNHNRLHQYSEMVDVCDWLISNGWADIGKSGIYAHRVWFFYFQALNFLDKLDDVFYKTQNWESESGDLFVVQCVARASAYRRQADKAFKSGSAQPKQVGKALLNASNVIGSLIIKEGCVDTIKPELRKLAGEIGYFSRIQNFQLLPEHKQQLAEFMIRNKRYIISEAFGRNEFEDVVKSIDEEFLRKSNQEEEGLNQKKEEYVKNGFTITVIKNIPKAMGFPNFLFSGDGQGNSYFIHVDKFSNGDWKKWVFLDIGSVIALKFKIDPCRDSRPATEAYLIE